MSEQTNQVSYAKCTYSYSNTTTLEDGKVTTETWKGGFGHETKNGETQYYALPPGSSGDYHEVTKDEYEDIRNRVDREVKKNKDFLLDTKPLEPLSLGYSRLPRFFC